ncbi:probable serine/threonine-protein kinase samkA [Microplitis mediator]|uniref:probable serine/threonine-protein kinase samkA n=1 Tax=Microplitis mediator TaxID=375433 RepID=UPI00255585D0|nr:probable serine/threonine-protein kinase samkA [Microplitis mediator]
MNFIKVSDEKFSVKLPVKRNKISLQTIKSYFPGASSLTYYDKSDKCGVELCNEEFELVQGISEYEIYYANSLKENNQNGTKKRRIQEIMDIIEGKPDENFAPQDLHNNSVQNEKISRKFLYIAWKHKTEASERFYKQMRDPVGGIKKIELDQNKEYFYEDIRKLALAAMRNNYNADTLDNSTIRLATNEEEIEDQFTDAKGKKFSRDVNMNKVDGGLIPQKSNLNQHSSSLKLTQSASKNVISLSHRRSGPSIILGTSSRVHKSEDVAIIGSVVKRGNSVQRVQSSAPTNDVIEPVSLSVPIIEENELEFTEKILGRGTFGCVILSKWIKNGSDVAVKKIRVLNNQKYLIREMQAMDIVRHPNIVALMAVCHTDDYVYIVMEYFGSTSLRYFINNRPVELEYPQKKNENYYICLQISKAVSYLHGLTPNIIHKDIKCDNILVNNHLVIKLCDLGLSKICDTSSTSALNTTVGHNFRGTPMYMAPEILIDQLPATTYSDIWAMACCIIELFTEDNVWTVKPVLTIPNLRQVVLDKKKPDLELIPISIKNILSECFNHEPTEANCIEIN